MMTAWTMLDQIVNEIRLRLADGLPHFYWTHLLDAASKGQLGRADAGASLARILEIKPRFSARVELQKWNAAPHDLDHIMDGLWKAGLREE